MSFVWVCIGMIAVLGVIAAVANRFDKGEDNVEQGHDCSSCTAAHDESCKLHCLMKEADKRRNGKMEVISLFLLLSSSAFLLSCSVQKNTSRNRFWHSFTARYNTYQWFPGLHRR